MNTPVRKELTPHMQSAPATVTSDASALMEIIGRLATDPNSDVSKVERYMAMYERITERAAEQVFNEAMSLAQTEMRPVAVDSNNPQTRSKYASYYALDKVMRPIYTAAGFALSFDTDEGAPADYIRVVCRVSHRSGYARQYHIDMPADGKGAKGGDVMTKTHAVGSGITYGQRYLLKMIFNIAVGDDDDGNSGKDAEKITEQQADTLLDLIESSGKDRAKFLKWAKVEKIADIPAAYYESCLAAIKAKANP